MFFTAVGPMNEPQSDELYDVKKATSGTLSNEVEIVQECSLLDQLEKCSRQD